MANRGEIAIRVFRTLRELGIGAVAVYSEADRGSLHVALADEAYLLGPGAPGESYLQQERVLDAARRAGAEAIHPGYGFLAENPSFARAVEERWTDMDRPAARGDRGHGLQGRPPGALMEAAGVPVIPGTTEPVESVAEVLALGEEHGWPLAIKASAGGGGKGLRVVALARRGRAGARRGAARRRVLLR